MSWWLASLDPRKEPPSFGTALLVSFLLAVFIVHLVPILSRIVPVEARITEKGITVIEATRDVKHCKYKDIRHWNLDLIEVNKREFTILTITMRKGRSFSIGVKPSISLEDLREILTQKVGSPNQNAPSQTGSANGVSFKVDE